VQPKMRAKDGDDESEDITLKMLMKELHDIKQLLVRGVPTPAFLKIRPKARGQLDDDVKNLTHRDYDETTMEDALQRGLHIGGVVKKWFEEKGFGFATIRGRDVFIHRDVVRVRSHLLVGGRRSSRS
jgi:hypothetical protein